MKKKIKFIARKLLPLSLRKRICRNLDAIPVRWLTDEMKYWWTMELLRDFAEQNPNEYHRFLWQNHMAYASSYEIELRFGRDKMPGSRRLFFNDLEHHLVMMGLNPSEEVTSVFEVGCSLGYQLRYLETNLFSSAQILEGIDIDEYAIKTGQDYLESVGSKIKLYCDDMGNIGQILGEKTYDLIICTGVLMYFDEKEAELVVENMLKHCGGMLALSGLASAEMDNSLLEQSQVRTMDGSFIHNFDRFVQKSGGYVFARRWEGKRTIEDQTIYFVFATKNESKLSSVQ